MEEETKKERREEKEEEKKEDQAPSSEEKKEDKEDPSEKEKKDESEKENTTHNKTLRNMFFILGGISLILLVGFFMFDSANNFEYRGITGNVVQEGDLIFYHTTLPALYQGQPIDYNFYLRNRPSDLDRISFLKNDPSKPEEISFEGELFFLKNTVINTTEEFNCEGKGPIAIVNLNNLYSFIGSKMINDPNATCDSQGRFMYLNLKPGDESKIEQVGPACYDLYINNCEIMEVTEKLMYETFVQITKDLEANPDRDIIYSQTPGPLGEQNQVEESA